VEPFGLVVTYVIEKKWRFPRTQKEEEKDYNISSVPDAETASAKG
jgi:hypothetical protein